MDTVRMLEERIKMNSERFSKINSTIKGRVTRTGVYLFDNVEMNFNQETFKNIKKYPEWLNRTRKRLPPSNENLFEMQSSKSSDALLMNIFCNPNFLSEREIEESGLKFGWNPDFKYEKKKKEYIDKKNEENKENSDWKIIGFNFTEIDLKTNNSIIEAKLTEKNFEPKKIDTVEKYDGFFTVFNTEDLSKVTDDNKEYKYKNYQLIRNILAAYKHNCNFILLIDNTRNDLKGDFENTKRAIKINKLRKKINCLTWQDLMSNCNCQELRNYISERYFDNNYSGKY